MATRKTASKTPARKTTVRKATSRAVKPTAKSTVAHRVVLAGLGAVERAQDSARKFYGSIAKNTGRFADMTTGAAQLLGEKAGVFVKEGQRIQLTCKLQRNPRRVSSQRKSKPSPKNPKSHFARI